MLGNILKYKRKQQNAQRALFDQYNQKLMSVAVRYVSSIDDAKDVIQEVFIRIFKNIDNTDFENNSFREAWMVRITVNESLRWLKKTKKHSNVQLQENVCSQIINSEGTNQQDLLKTIYTLPEGYRLVFNLYCIEGYSHKEIAQLLNIKESASRSQLTRARQLLQRKLKGQYERAK